MVVRPYSSQVAAEVDRLVVGIYTASVTSDDPPGSLDGLDPYSAALLHTAAFVLAAGSMTFDDLTRVAPYTPRQLMQMAVEQSVGNGVLEPDPLSLTEVGRGFALGVVELQERTAETAWAAHRDAVDVAGPIAADVVRRALPLTPPIEPGAFPLFAGLRRPTPAAQLLRSITALRYWRADAHRRALADAELTAAEAHALNRRWDEHRGVERVGQNYPEVDADVAAALEARGLSEGGMITAAGLTLREGIEATTDRLCDPLYDGLDASARAQLLDGLVALPER